MTLNTFEAVARRYDTTKPLVSTTHPAEQDLRPLGSRRRKWERIKKINDGCYALMTWSAVSDIDSFYGAPRSNPHVTDADIMRAAPIVWTKKGDTELCTVHNSLGVYAAGWYSFLVDYLPVGMWFRNRNGQHYLEVQTETGREEYYLPHNKYTYAHDYRLHHKDGAYGLGSTPKFERKLVFERVGDYRWKLVSPAYERKHKSKYVVNADKKRGLKPLIDAFREWLEIIGPIIALPEDLSARQTYFNRLKADAEAAWPTEEIHVWMYGEYWRRVFTPERMLEILKDDEHPMRVHLATAFLNYNRERVNLYEYRCEKGNEHLASSPEKIRARYNRFMNVQLGLIKENT